MTAKYLLVGHDNPMHTSIVFDNDRYFEFVTIIDQAKENDYQREQLKSFFRDLGNLNNFEV